MTNKPTRGGSRKGAGQPRKPDSEKAKARTMRFTDAEWAKLTKLGRAKWIREQLTNAPD